VVSSKLRPQPQSTELAPPRAEEVPTVVVEAGASIAPLLPVPDSAVEEGEAATEATATQAALVTPTKAGPGGEDVVVVLDEDSAPPPSSESRDVVMPPASGPAQVAVTASVIPAVEVPEPSPAAEVPGPPQTAEVAETSSARDALTAEEVMKLATCRYIDFPGIGVIDLEAPQLLEKVFESERMFNENDDHGDDRVSLEGVARV
jgi:hypothetical protein